ncbi:MAG: ParB N-terminal domain-containing protein [Gammaproteobacteria bacterium]|nr:ParB N-terminal domain-containing protein [Gammaproteobacteria bacterium]
MPNSPECRLDTVPIHLIDLGDRARKDYKDIASLASDIQNRGQLQPIAVMEDSKGGYVLLAGGRRLTAMRHAEIPTIDCKIWPHGLSELEIKSIELMENVMREDLNYVEKVKLQREILQLQQTIHGVKTSGSPYETGVSPNDVANMLGIS